MLWEFAERVGQHDQRDHTPSAIQPVSEFGKGSVDQCRDPEGYAQK